jgi:hydroxypyruvate isomerase
MRIAANLSLLFTERPLPERIAAARAAGFEGVEIQFPYDHPAETLAAAARAAAMPVVLINIPAGDAAAGDIGLGAIPARRDPAECRATLLENLRHAAAVFAPHGIRTVLEPVNPMDRPGFFLDRLAPAIGILREAATPAAGLLFDLYHMARTEPDLIAAIGQAGRLIGHVQFADTPGRHEPGTGTIDFAAAFAALRRAGYADWVAAEYNPLARTEDGLRWMPALRGALAERLPRHTP